MKVVHFVFVFVFAFLALFVQEWILIIYFFVYCFVSLKNNFMLPLKDWDVITAKGKIVYKREKDEIVVFVPVISVNTSCTYWHEKVNSIR